MIAVGEHEAMSHAEQPEFVDVVSYLEQENRAEVKHEYVDGWVREMAGGSNRHNRIATNTLVAFGIQLQGKPCQPYNSDAKVKIQKGRSTWFYYPDAMVVCDENSEHDSFQQSPVLIVEVLSKSTRAIDLDEKLNNYLSIPSLHYLLLLEQVKPRAILMRRSSQGFLRQIYEGLDATIPLEQIECALCLRDLYARVSFDAESIREELADYMQSSH